jgi:transketolase
MDLHAKANSIRREIIKFKTHTGNGHLASALSVVDILVSLYYDDETWFNHQEDEIIWGKAHGGPAVYPILCDLGYFSREELTKYCRPSGILRLHPDGSIPGCNFVGGSLGNGIGYAAGLAFANPGKKYVVMLGDAELYEGSVWDSLIFISHFNLSNLLIIVDRNGLGILGSTEELLRLEPLSEKFKSFGFEVINDNGHDFEVLRRILKSTPVKPTVFVAMTIKAKGVAFMEGRAEYHTIIPRDKETVEQMLNGLT